MISQILGWVANGFFLYGVWILGNKNIRGFYANIIANFLYIIQSIIMNNSALLWCSIFLILINAKGIYQWKFGKQ